MNFERLLVATKFAPPRIGARFIVRKHLLDELRRERARKLVLVPGSAGFGKTILLAQWRQELMKDGLQVGWLSLSPDERQLANFSAHLFAALIKLGLPIESDLPLIADHGRSTDAAVAAVVNHLAAVEDELYLIIDDYHHVEDPLAHSLLQKIVELSPGNLHVIIASRALPPLSVARLRVMGQVAEIDCAALPFDLSETRAFLEQAIGAGVSADEVSQIQDLTHGWPACVQLVSIMLKNRPERRTMLRRIEEENLLVSRVESEERSPWYRFHPLFADFLAARLQRRGQEAVDQLHRCASAWCAEKGLVLEAVRHAGLGRDLDSAVAIFERAAPASWRLGHFGPMLHLLNHLPTETVRAHPRLLLLASLATALTGRPARASVWAEQFRASGGGDGRGGAFRVALLEALIASQRDDTARTRELLAPFRAGDARTSLERYVFLSIYGYSLAADGQYEDAHRLLDENPPPPDDRNEDLAIVTESCHSPWRLLEGRALDAQRIGEPARARALAVLGAQSIGANLLSMSLADTFYEIDRTADASKLLANRLHNLSTFPTEPMINAALTRARLTVLQESPAAALTQLDDHVALFRSLGLERGMAHALGEQVRIALAMSDRPRAGEAMRRLEDVAARNAGAEGFRGDIAVIAGLARARLALSDRAYEAALADLSDAGGLARMRRRGRMVVTAELLTALAMDASGRSEEALALLGGLLERVAPTGLVRTFVDQGDAVRDMLARLPRDPLSASATAFAESLLAAFGHAECAADAGVLGAKGKTPLTPREVEILGLVATGMSNKRIALTLNITLETVKWNLKNVFVKLAVSSRYDAMIWARHQGLIA